MYFEGFYDFFVFKLVSIYGIFFIFENIVLCFEVCFCEFLFCGCYIVVGNGFIGFEYLYYYVFGLFLVLNDSLENF